MARKIFVNLPVKDLQTSIAFFTGLGFSFNPKFTDESATCMLIGTDSYAMLLPEARFKDFTTRAISDTSKATEVLIALSCENRDEVDALVGKALKTGGKIAMPPSDLGFMYTRSFYDIDGHHWEIFHMDPSVAEG
ncbi:MAG TPA: VOC family protein [Hyphomicrobium sp.]|nr:VOC family protein [Hyphomicrobium sp.]